MSSSIRSFQIAYPSWDPNDDGKQFLASLKTFRDQKLRGQGTAALQTASGMVHQTPRFRGFGASERDAMFSRETVFNNMGNFHQFDSMWLIDCEQKNFPYILEWYYTSHNHDRDEDNSREMLSRSYDQDEENPPALWMPSHLAINTPKYDDGKWDDNLFEDRAQSHLEASTSVPLYQESVLQQHHESNGTQHPGRSHWWARTRPQGPGQETSFLEPPNFFHEASHDDGDNYSDKRSGEEYQLDLRNSRGLSRTFYMDDLNGGNFNLPFVDIYEEDPLDGGSGSVDSDPPNQV